MTKETEKAPKVSKKDTQVWARRRKVATHYIMVVGLCYVVFTQLGGWQQRNFDNLIKTERENAVQEYTVNTSKPTE